VLINKASIPSVIRQCLALITVRIVRANFRIKAVQIEFGFMTRFGEAVFVSPQNSSKENYPVMQFTGMLDANGVKIFEGDIVVIPDEYIWFDNGEPNYRGVVEMIYSSWGVTAHCVNSEKRGISNGINYMLNDDGVSDNCNSSWLVIGNIHQNPELIA